MDAENRFSRPPGQRRTVLRTKELPARIERSVQARRKKLIRLCRQLSSPLRVLPDALIIGVQKGGTTSLYHYLSQHPRVFASSKKEPGFFSKNYDLGQRWYRSFFPLRWQVDRCGGVSFEASTSTICHPLAAERANHHLPDARLIALLRDPVERAWSHFHHTVRRGREALPFEEAIWKEEERMCNFWARVEREPESYELFNEYTYLSRGLYAQQLQTWIERFGRDRLLVLASEELYRDPRGATEQVVRFLGLEPHEETEYRPLNEGSNKIHEMPDKSREQLVAYYAPHNDALYRLIGRDLGWQQPGIRERPANVT